MRVIDRFDQYMKAKDLNDNRVTVQLGLAVGTIGKSRREGRDLSKKVIKKLLDYYNDLDETWLLTGNGEMLCEPRAKEETPVGVDEEEKVQVPAAPSTIEKLVDGLCSTEATIDKLVVEMSKAHDLVAKSQEQFDRILNMLESEKISKSELEKVLIKKLESSLK